MIWRWMRSGSAPRKARSKSARAISWCGASRMRAFTRMLVSTNIPRAKPSRRRRPLCGGSGLAPTPRRNALVRTHRGYGLQQARDACAGTGASQPPCRPGRSPIRPWSRLESWLETPVDGAAGQPRWKLNKLTRVNPQPHPSSGVRHAPSKGRFQVHIQTPGRNIRTNSVRLGGWPGFLNPRPLEMQFGSKRSARRKRHNNCNFTGRLFWSGMTRSPALTGNREAPVALTSRWSGSRMARRRRKTHPGHGYPHTLSRGHKSGGFGADFGRF